MKPLRWHLYIVDLEPRVGTKPGKQRPCICVQPSEFCEMGLPSAVVLPITTQIKNNAIPLRVRIPQGTNGLDKESDILVDQILSWDCTLFKKDLGEIPEALQAQVQLAMKDFLDL